jgi:hypothetical protein
MGHCHCSICRKVSGAAYATFVGGAAGGFTWVAGESSRSAYQASAVAPPRHFCRRCGSIAPGVEAEHAFMAAGCLDDDPEIRAGSHIFVASKAPWFELSEDGVPRFDAAPPGAELPTVDPRPPLPRASELGRVRGSCQCGGVVYESGRPRALVYCHCSRCRKGRSAAFGANLFSDASGFSYQRGRELLERFQVPEAERFAVTFCRVCGGSLPGHPGDGALAVIPAGSLDDEIGALPEVHIFTADRAPWVEIPAEAEQYPGYPDGYASTSEWVLART